MKTSIRKAKHHVNYESEKSLQTNSGHDAISNNDLSATLPAQTDVKCIQRNGSKYHLRLFLITRLVFLVILAIIVLRVLYPYHMVLAVAVYLLTELVFLTFLLKKIFTKKKKNSFMIFFTAATLALFLVFLYLLIVFFPPDFVNLTPEQIKDLEVRAVHDKAYLLEMIYSAEDALSSLNESGLLDIMMETSDPEKVTELKDHFRKIVEHIIVFDSVADKYSVFYKTDGQLHEDAFMLAYTAHLARFFSVYSLDSMIGKNRYVITLLDENILGIGQGTYTSLRSRIVETESIIQLRAGKVYMDSLELPDEPLRGYAEKYYTAIFHQPSQNVIIRTETALDTLESGTINAWLPVQRTIANFLGDTRLGKRHGYFISEEQISDISIILEPGDIIFQRRNWYMSNAGMPGFWTHAALYVGTFDELDSYFWEESHAVFNTSFSDYLLTNHPEIYQQKAAPYGQYLVKTIEAKPEGVVMLPIEVSASADYLAVISPLLSRTDKMKAVFFAMMQVGKQYDYNFDFATDDAYVCSELVYKAYLPTSDKAGLSYSLGRLAGRWMISPNDMVREFDMNYKTGNQQNKFIVFLDGNESSGTANLKGVAEFRNSWQRPKYDWMLS